MRNLPPVSESPSSSRHSVGAIDPQSCLVVGSGPAGVACAKALLERGKKVHMLDAGLVLEPERLELVERLRQDRPEAWKAADMAAFKSGVEAGAGGLPQKLVYGSDFPYRGAEEHLGVVYSHVGLRPSLARGGLSNVWGAAMMPFLQQDVQDWPIPVATLHPHYEAVLQLTGLAARRDSLAARFPLFSNHFAELRPSRQAQRLLDRMAAHQDVLKGAGIFFGQSRLAVQAAESGGNHGCVYCTLCMYGCPYGYIYSSTNTLPELQKSSNFSYQSGVIATAVREKDVCVELSGYDRVSHQPLIWECERVFLAAGAIPTTQILLRSLKAYQQTVWLKDTQYFLLPLVAFTRTPGARTEPLHALSQIFLELIEDNSSARTVHIQIYSYNDLIGQAIAQAFGPLKWPLGGLVRDLQERVLVAQGFLHSELSGRISVRLEKNAGNGRERLVLRGEPNASSKEAVKQVVRTLTKNARSIGARPLSFMLKMAEPGRSFHSGGSFPMRAHPRQFETDVLGRPAGWQRVHAVDATILPSIPATTITLSVMANAHRIGWETAYDEKERVE